MSEMHALAGAGQLSSYAVVLMPGTPFLDFLRTALPFGGSPPGLLGFAGQPEQPPEGGAAAPVGPKGEQGEGQEKRQPLPRGEAERRALALLAEHPGEDFTPGRIAREIDARGCRDLMARLHARGVVEMVNEHPLTYRAAKPKRSRKKSQP